MPINIGDNFSYRGKKFLDNRESFKTIEDLDACKDVPIGFLSYCEETGMRYEYTGNEWIQFIAGGAGFQVVDEYDDIEKLVGVDLGLIYVKNDVNNQDRPNIYVVVSVKRNNDGKQVVDEYAPLSEFTKGKIPVLSYDESMPEGEKIYINNSQELVLRFNFTSETYGDANYKIFRDGALIKSITGPKGTVIENLGKIETNGTYEISVTATDYLGIPSDTTLKWTVVVGGLELTSTFDKTLAGMIYEVGDTLTVPYEAIVSDKTATIKILFKLYREGVLLEESLVDSNSPTASGLWQCNNTSQNGLYSLTIQAYTGMNLNDESAGSFKSNILTYNFNILAENEIAISSQMTTASFTTEDYISLSFKVVSNLASYFLVRGKVYELVGDTWQLIKETSIQGISVAVNTTSYWSIGRLGVGSYKYELTAYTVDEQVSSLKNAEGGLVITQSQYTRIEPTKANLICWFDANEKRNTDTDKDIWYNNTSLGDSYRVLLHGLNYKTNGWKHIKGLSDDSEGEFMLKFTGDSYGELVKVNTDGTTTRYNPFSIFSNAGQQGITIETAIRTRCIGEMDTKVLTCMEGKTKNTPGVSIDYNSVNLGSDSQTVSLEIMEDEWIHVALVVDKGIRNLSNVGQDNIENLNQTYSMRIYINGVLCACNSFKTDKFLDAAGKSFPLILNACLVDNTIQNFGSCEMKFLRIYNGILTSSDVLNNYIAQVYDSAEQQAMRDRNDVVKSPLPTIRFKRNTNSSNNTTFSILNSITDKKMSKSTCVDCIMEYDDGFGNKTVFTNVDVYLQGTSSLQYPVKNYKIKCYQDEAHSTKKKIVPPGREEIWHPDYTYTFKVDYMEQSHRNNTPTAKFYDKVINALGGESPALKDGYRDAIDGFACIVYYNDDPDNAEDTLVGSFMWNIDKSGVEIGFECDLYDEEGNVIGNGEDCCVSYEGTANASNTAGCFYKMEESIESVYAYYIEDSYEEYLNNNGLNSTQVTIDDFRDGIANGSIDYMTYEEFILDYDEIDYVMADFEARFSFNEDDNEATYRPMVNLVNWVSESTANGTFKDDFEEHFDLKYMLAYYLQMQVFTQVDNCGKNCMWDTWDHVKFYPRPYDMDTSNGLSNTGTETITPQAELLPELSPIETEGTYAGYSNNDTVSDLRYLSFNTKTSKLWNNFAKDFADEIKDAYKQLRSSGIYSVANITTFMDSMTIDVIGEIYYNKDAASKYLSQTTDSNSEYLKMLHGNRTQKYKKHITDRLTFLDTVYDYMESEVQYDTSNSIITLRSDALYGESSMETLRCYLGISVYSPQYVTISVGSGQDAIVTAYVSPDSTYLDPDTGIQYEGTLFSFPIRGTDKEMTISGAGNIKRINRLETLNVRDLVIAKAEKIMELNLANSSRMTALALGNNKYLRDLDCSYSYLLGTATNGQLLDMSQCVNLENVNLAYTKLSSVNFPENATLKKIDITGSTIQAIVLDGQEFLQDIIIEACDSITTFKVNNCTSIPEIDVSNSTIKSFIATNCGALTRINLSNCRALTSFDVLNSNNINNLNMSGCNGPVMNDLQLYTMYNLETFNGSQSTSLNTIKFPKYLNEFEAAKAAKGEDALPWNTLKSLNVSYSSLKTISYGSGLVSEEVCDLSQLTNLTSLILRDCTVLTEIRNINYTGGLSALFYNCPNLTKISGVISNNGTSINSLFGYCKKLADISNLTFNFNGVTSADGAIDRCYMFTTAMLKRILDACGSTLTSATNMCVMPDGTCLLGQASDRANRDIPSNLFENTPNLRNISGMFDITNYTTIPGNLLDPIANSLTNASGAFRRMGSLTTVGVNLFKNKPNLTDVSYAFAYDGALAYYIHEDPNIFEGSPNITTTREMFLNNSALRLGSNSLGDMFTPLVNLTQCHYMFYNCSSTYFNQPLPEGLLSKCTKLQKIDGLFQSCTKLPSIPNSLFRKSIGDTNTFPNLTQARNVFANCTSLAGILSANFFNGCTNLRDIGSGVDTSQHMSTAYYPSQGFFYNTKLTGYFETFLASLTNLQNCSGFFRQNSQSTTLKDCYYYQGSTEMQYSNGITPNLFKYNSYIQDCSYMFANNISLLGCIPENLFDTVKSTLMYANHMFYNCTGLSGTNLDNTDPIVSSTVGISNKWFKNAVNLRNINSFLEGCNGFISALPSSLLEGCKSLQNVSSMFRGCTNITGELDITLFNDCRDTLTNTSYMFYGCTGLTGVFPVGTYSTIQGINGYEVCLSTDEGALLVVNTITDATKQVAYATVVGLAPSLAAIIVADSGYYVKPTIGDIVTIVQHGLLSECLQLTNTSYMFAECLNLGKGSCIPHDIFFTSSLTKRYEKLTNTSYMFYRCGFDQAYIDTNTELHYLCSENFFNKCPAITNVESMFRSITAIPACSLYQTMFDRQVNLQNAKNLFFGVTNLTGNITQNFMRNCLSTLLYAERMFCFTNITSVVATFLNNNVVNKKLQTVGAIFYGCSNITGASPQFWNSDFFTAIQGTSAGYYGALYNCTKLSNYSTAQGVSVNWTAAQSIYRP